MIWLYIAAGITLIDIGLTCRKTVGGEMLELIAKAMLLICIVMGAQYVPR